MTNRDSHSLADILVALNVLSPLDDEAINAIFEILGIRIEYVVTKTDDIELSKKIKEPSRVDKGKNVLNETSSASSEVISTSTKNVLPSILTPMEKTQNDRPKWFFNPLSLRNKESSIGPFTSYPLQTLFAPNLIRAILATSLSIYENFGPININEIIRKISLNEPVKEIPLLPWPTMVHGVQILVDDSETLEPFIKDQIKLISAVRKIAGSDRTQILRFVGCPLRGVQYNIFDDLSDYYPPSDRSTVVLITDLGVLRDPNIFNHSQISEWLRFASIVRNANCSLIAFVPYPKNRWPKQLQDAIKIIQWDRRTSISTIQKIVKR